MKIISVCLALIALITCMAMTLLTAVAAAPTTPNVQVGPSIVTSQGRAIYVLLDNTEAGEGLPVIKARLEQDLHVLENVFQQILRQTGRFGGRYPILVIRTRQGTEVTAQNNGATPIATLSRTPIVAFIDGFPVTKGPLGKLIGGMRTENLGRGYIIETTADRLSFQNLLAFILLLPRLHERSPVITVYSEDILSQVKNSQEFQDFSRLVLALGHPGLWNTEGKSLSATWQAGILYYDVTDFVGNKLYRLQPLPYYLAKPGWSPPIPRFIAGATTEELLVRDTSSGKTHRLDLTDLFPAEYLQMSETIELTVTPQGERIYFTLSFNLPETFWQREEHSYVYNLLTQILSVAPAQELPSSGVPEQPAEPATERGAIPELTLETPSAGYNSPVLQLRGYGWPQGQLSRQKSYLAAHWTELLPKDEPLVFQPAWLLYQNRYIAYASQKEILVFDTLAREYHRLNLRELRAADYNKIGVIRFAQNPNSAEAKIYFFLEKCNQAMTGYLWDLQANKLALIEQTLAQMQREGQDGWWEFTAGALSLSLPSGTQILTGGEARISLIKEVFFSLVNVLVSMLIWLGSLFFTFLLPFVLATIPLLLVARKLKSSHLLSGYISALSALFFIGLSIMTLRLAMPYSEKIENLVYPLIWFTAGSTAGMMLMWGFMVIVTTLLTILVFNQSRLLFCSFFQDVANDNQTGKGIAVSANTVYGIAGAVLLFLLFAFAVVTLPYRLPPDLTISFLVAIFYIFCLAGCFFLLKSPLVFAGYLTSASAFLGIAILGYHGFRFNEFTGAISLEAWVSQLASVLPLTLICLVYLLRAVLESRNQIPKISKALLEATLLAVPVTAIIIFGERLHWYLPQWGYFALPAALVLFTLTIASMLASLVQVFHISVKRSKLPASLQPTTAPVSAAVPIATRLKISVRTIGPASAVIGTVGPASAVIVALLILVILVDQAVAGTLRLPGGYQGLLLLLMLLYLAVSSIFYVGQLITARLASLIGFTEKSPANPEQ